MLSWLGGQRSGDGGMDQDTTLAEPPETPAPVFAVRAFKHAIFGTPQTVQPKQRRNSTAEHQRPRQLDIRTGRPGLAHKRSNSEAHVLIHPDIATDVDPPVSPTKGILMTPGTAAARRKTVSFGEEVVDNEEKRVSKSGLPDDCPGKFPSPWVNKIKEPEFGSDVEDRPRSRSKLTEALEQVREESAKRKFRLTKLQKPRDSNETMTDIEDPHGDSNQHWKHEYDIYRERTTREVKKWVVKYKAAKNYAREKDAQCTQLTEQLQQERSNVERLERQATELEAQMRELQERLRRGQLSDVVSARAAQDVTREVTPISYNDRSSARATGRSSQDSSRGIDASSRSFASRMRDKVDTVLPNNVKAITRHDEVGMSRPAPSDDATYARPRTRPRNTLPRKQSDIWATASMNEDPMLAEHEIPTGRTVTSGTEATPLQSLDVKALSQQNKPKDQVAPSVTTQVPPARQDSALPSPGVLTRQPLATIKASATESQGRVRSKQSMREQLPSTSTVASTTAGFDSTFLPSDVGTPAAIRTIDRMDVKVAPQRDENNMRPSSAWTAMNTSTLPSERRVIGKDGKEIGAERLAAARARLQARGRNVS